MRDRLGLRLFRCGGGGELANAREQYLQAISSLTEMTRTRAEQLASRLAKQGDLQSGQVGRFAEDLVRRTQRNRETMSRLIQREVKRQLSVIGIATRDEVARLQQRVRALEQEAERHAAASRSGAAKTTGSGAAKTTGSGAAKPTRSGGTRATGAKGTKATGASGTGTARGTARKAASGTTGGGGGRRAGGSAQTGQDRTEGE
jgi:polyhydroxyalkanoate synthesis regulator phasin